MMNKQGKTNAFTEKEAKEIGAPLELLNRWQFVMNTLWRFFLAYADAEKEAKIKNSKNEIIFKLGKGHKFVIGCFMYNNSYLSLNIKIDGSNDFEATLNMPDIIGEAGMIRFVSNILTEAEKIIL